VSRLAAEHMAKYEPDDEERGVIINTAAIAAFAGQIGQGADPAAKAGIAGRALTMARDLGSLRECRYGRIRPIGCPLFTLLGLYERALLYVDLATDPRRSIVRRIESALP
jgi:hypothetical protein